MSDLADEIKDVFLPRGELYVLRREASRAFNAPEWASYQKAAKQFDEERLKKRQSFNAEYASRVSRAQKKFIDEAGSVKRELTPKGVGVDHFDKSLTYWHAQREVRFDHDNDMMRIDQRECEVLSEMLSKAREREELRRLPTTEFQKSVDRRSSTEIRVRTRSR